MSGQGRMDFPDGSSYEGDYLMDMKNGEGTFIWSDGRVYKGQWSDGQQDGVGCVIDTTGEKTHGTWRRGIQVATGISSERQAQGTRNPSTPGNTGLVAVPEEAALYDEPAADMLNQLAPDDLAMLMGDDDERVVMS